MVREMTLNIQFSDSSESVIISLFSCPQDPKVWPNQGVVDTNDPRWKVYYDSQPPNLQQFFPAPS